MSRNRIARAQSPGAARFSRPLHAYEIVTAQDHPCRVCAGTLAAGMTVLFRAWGVEYAHRACGWLRADEREPHELRGAHAPRAWEWACPRCRTDVVRSAPPALAFASLRLCPKCRAADELGSTP